MLLIVGWLISFLFAPGSSWEQQVSHIRWRFTSIEQPGSEWKITFTATVDRGWHLYSQSLDPDGPMPTEFKFERSDSYRLVGSTSEVGDLKKSYDSTFMVNVAWYEGEVEFSQVVKVKPVGDVKLEVRGEIKYSVCSEETCIPGNVKFSIPVGR